MSTTLMTDYLTEQSLGIFLRERLDPNIQHNKTLRINGKNYRPDYLSEDKNVIVEFDGYQHYTRAAIVVNDQTRDDNLASAGYKVIRIPYFVQLDRKVITIEFDDLLSNYEPFNSFEHGFIDPKATLPADFCDIGNCRFGGDLRRFSYIETRIIGSLVDWVERYDYDWRKVMPYAIWHDYIETDEDCEPDDTATEVTT